MNSDVLLSLACIGLLGIACQWLAWWARMPAILFLLVSGIVVGPATGLLQPDQLFGHLLFPAVSLSVAVVLFEGSLTLRLHEIKGVGAVVRNLVTIGAILTWLVAALATHWLFGFEFRLAALFGAVMVVTGPTVIIPMLRTVRPNATIANILRWEGIIIDPLGALLAVLAFDLIITSESRNALPGVLLSFGRLVVVGSAIGIAAAGALGYILRRHLIPEFLRSVFTLTLVFGVYAAADLVAHESGLLAVTIMGLTLGNMKDTDVEDILDFKESLSVLLISALFIVLAARIEPGELIEAGWPALVLLAVVMLVARPLAVFVATFGSDVKWRERLLIAWIGPRGIVCAAVAAVFALRLQDAGVAHAELLVPLAFLITIGTVLLQSATAKPLARWLSVREPPPTGFLIVGAGNVARAIAKALQEHGVKVRLTDSAWDNTRLARMEGLDTYYGNPISEHADTHLDLVGLGRVLAMSGRSNLDALACLRFKSEFGSNNVYELRSTREQIMGEKHKIGTRHRGRQLFGKEITYGTIAGWLRDGAEIRATVLSGEFNFEEYLGRHGDRALPLFAIDPKGRTQMFTAEDTLKPEAEWKIVALVRPEGAGGMPPTDRTGVTQTSRKADINA